MLNILFKAAPKTLLLFGENVINGKLGFVAGLHNWDQQLKDYFHLHNMVAGGAVCTKIKRWIPLKTNYLLTINFYLNASARHKDRSYILI